MNFKPKKTEILHFPVYRIFPVEPRLKWGCVAVPIMYVNVTLKNNSRYIYFEFKPYVKYRNISNINPYTRTYQHNEKVSFTCLSDIAPYFGYILQYANSCITQLLRLSEFSHVKLSLANLRNFNTEPYNNKKDDIFLSVHTSLQELCNQSSKLIAFSGLKTITTYLKIIDERKTQILSIKDIHLKEYSNVFVYSVSYVFANIAAGLVDGENTIRELPITSIYIGVDDSKMRIVFEVFDLLHEYWVVEHKDISLKSNERYETVIKTFIEGWLKDNIFLHDSPYEIVIHTDPNKKETRILKYKKEKKRFKQLVAIAAIKSNCVMI